MPEFRFHEGEKRPCIPLAVRVRDVREWAGRRDGEGRFDVLMDGSGGGELVASVMVMERAVGAEVGAKLVGTVG
jgi:hypothetical protein